MDWLTQTCNAFPSFEIGDDDGITIIVRDRANEDKVVKVIEPLDTVHLTYNPDNDNRLAFVKTVWPEYEGLEISQIIKLGYQDYLNSNDEVDNVVVTVEQRTWAKNADGSTTEFIGQPGGEAKYQNLQHQLTTQESENATSEDWTTPGELFPDV